MPVKDVEQGEPRTPSVEELQARLEEAQKVIDALNKRLAKVIKLYNAITDMYVQGE